MTALKHKFTVCAVVLFVVIISIAISVKAFTSANIYEPGVDNGNIDAERIGAFAASMHNTNIELSHIPVDDIITTVTFSDKITFEDVGNYILEHKVTPVLLHLRGYAPDGTRVTVFSRTDKGLEDTKTLLLQQAKDDGYVLAGIIGLNCLVDSARLDDLHKDKLTYVVDTSGDMCFVGKLERNSVSRNALDEQGYGEKFPVTAFWDMEDTGVVDMTTVVIDSTASDVNTAA